MKWWVLGTFCGVALQDVNDLLLQLGLVAAAMTACTVLVKTSIVPSVRAGRHFVGRVDRGIDCVMTSAHRLAVIEEQLVQTDERLCRVEYQLDGVQKVEVGVSSTRADPA